MRNENPAICPRSRRDAERRGLSVSRELIEQGRVQVIARCAVEGRNRTHVVVRGSRPEIVSLSERRADDIAEKMLARIRDKFIPDASLAELRQRSEFSELKQILRSAVAKADRGAVEEKSALSPDRTNALNRAE